MGSKREKDRPDFTPEQAKYNQTKFTQQLLNIGKKQDLVCIRGVWRRKGEDKAPPERLDVLVAKLRDKKWRQQYE